EIERILGEIRTEGLLDGDRAQLRQAIARVVKQVSKRPRSKRILEEESRGRRLVAAKMDAAESKLSWLRDVRGQRLFLADLTSDQQKEVRTSWKADWTKACVPWGQIEKTDLWRCGGAVFCLCTENLSGKGIGKEPARTP